MIQRTSAITGDVARIQDAMVVPAVTASALQREQLNVQQPGKRAQVPGHHRRLHARPGCELLSMLERAEQARDALREGESVLRDFGDRLELAKLLCRPGRLDIADGDHDAARAAMAEAEATASALGARPESSLGHEIDKLRRAPA